VDLTNPCVGFQGELHGVSGRDLPAFVDAHIVSAVVATLEYKPDFCIGAAAGTIALLAHNRGGGKALMVADAIPALVRTMKLALPPSGSATGASLLWR
jgi:hypothetical protein